MSDGSALARNWNPVSLAQLIEAHGEVEDIRPVGHYPAKIPRLPPRKPRP